MGQFLLKKEVKYFILKSRMDKAIQHAKKAHQIHMSQEGVPSTWCSCTTVYQLMEELNKWKNKTE